MGSLFKWMSDSLGFNIFLFCLINFNALSDILTGQMTVLKFIFDAVILWIAISNTFRILEERKLAKGEDKPSDE